MYVNITNAKIALRDAGWQHDVKHDGWVGGVVGFVARRCIDKRCCAVSANAVTLNKKCIQL